MKNKTLFKRITSAFLAMILTFTSVPDLTLYSHAAGLTDVFYDICAQAGEEEINLHIVEDEFPSIEYGQPITLFLKDSLPGQKEIFYYDADTQQSDEAETYENNSVLTLEPGHYRFGYYFMDSNEDYTGQDYDMLTYGLTVEKTPLATVTGLEISGTVGRWDTVTKDHNDRTVTGTCKYSVNLYKKHALVKTYEDVTENTCDFSEYIINDGGCGEYSFSVIATPNSTQGKYYSNSEETDECEDSITAIDINISKSIGIDKVTKGGVEVDKVTLIDVYETYNKVTLNAVLAATWGFNKWIKSESVPVTFSNENSVNTDVTIDSTSLSEIFEEEHVYEYTINASTTEANAPVISAFTAGTAEDAGKLIATAIDDQTGIVGYAFSTSTTNPSVEEFEEVDVTLESADFEFTPTASGNYYFYVMDSCGNIGKSTESIPVSKIIYLNYYENNVKITDLCDYYIGSEVFVPRYIGIGRAGYDFLGYLDSESNPADTLSENNGVDVTLTAIWQLELFGFGTYPLDLNEIYKGEAYTISAALFDNTAESVTYSLMKKGENGIFTEVKTSNDGSFAIRNANESGNYRIDAKISHHDINGDAQIYTHEGAGFSVEIAKATLYVTADDKEITYKDAIPELTASYSEEEGKCLVGDDVDEISQALITVGALKTYYDPEHTSNSNAGTYNIVQDTAISSYSSENYDIVFTMGTLTVNPKNVETDESIDIHINNQDAQFMYTGSAITPAFTCKDGDETIDESQYTLTYLNNILAKEADAEINPPTIRFEFKNNYTGTVELKFTISKSNDFEPATTIDGWTYGDTPNDPEVENIHENDDYEFWYLTGSNLNADYETIVSTGTKTKPTNAGTYTVYAIIAETENYQRTIATGCEFTIAKKTFYIEAGSHEFPYDGNPHSWSRYTVYKLVDDEKIEYTDPNDAFVLSSESFQSIEVSGSITNYSDEPVANNVTYALSSTTNAHKDNYDIKCIPGELTVSKAKLLAPTNLLWDYDNPGTATWIATVKTNLTVEYTVKLYMHDEENGDDHSEDELIDTQVTSSIKYNFNSKIHEQEIEAAQKDFYFTVSVSPKSGSNAKNYSASDDSGMSAVIYTATISTTTDDRTGLKDVYLADEELENGCPKKLSADSITIIQGETVCVGAEAEFGYEIYTGDFYVVGAPNTTDFAFTNRTTPGSGSGKRFGYIRFLSNVNHSMSDILVSSYVYDKSPTTQSYTVVTKSDNSGVDFKIKAKDDLGITSIQLIRVEQYEYFNEATNKTELLWRDISESDRYGKTFDTPQTSIDETLTVTKPGTYQMRISDASSTIRLTSKHSVFELSFDGGEGELIDPDAPMNNIYKLADEKPEIPECAFAVTGKTFKNWQGDDIGIVADKAKWAANVSDNVVAQWTSESYLYKVQYYYMNNNGTYNSTFSSEAAFKATYGTVITESTAEIQKPQPNYTLDTSEGKTASITIDGPNKEIKVYYKTGVYTVSYSYTTPDGEEHNSTKDFHYNQAIDELAKPTYAGYDFVGWDYEGFGAKPEAMPNKDIKATGYFVPRDAKYYVVYHMETLGAGETKTGVYEADEKLFESLKGKQDDVIKVYAPSNDTPGKDEYIASSIAGFTFAGTSISYAAAQDDNEEIPEDVVTEQKNVTIQSATDNEVYINLYYTRNVYTLSVEVYKDNREAIENLYFKKTSRRQFGEALSVTKYALDATYTSTTNVLKDDDDNAFVMPENYKFTSYTDYSSGNAPSSMPAGDVTITRDIISTENIEYSIELYFEKADIGVYEKMTTLTYSAPVGSTIHVIDTEQTDTSDNKYLNYKTLVKTVNNSKYYTHTITENSYEEGTLTSEEPFVLKLYFERITTDATIAYYYGNSTVGSSNTLFSFKVSGKWGTRYTFDPDAVFDAVTESWFNDSIYKNANNTFATGNISYTSNRKDIALNTDFRNGRYLVSYQCYYKYFDQYENIQGTWPSQTFTTIGDSTTKPASTLNVSGKGYSPSTSGSAGGLENLYTCYFSPDNSAYCHISYNQIREVNNFYLLCQIKPYSNSACNGNRNSEPGAYPNDTYPDSIDITYKYNNVDYPVRVMNMCAVVSDEGKQLVPASGGLDRYPAAGDKTRKYNYTDLDKVNTGFHHITGDSWGVDYYYYDGTGDYGTNQYVVIANYEDKFIEGAYTSYSHNTKIKAVAGTDGVLKFSTDGSNNSNEYTQYSQFLVDYQTLHGDESNETYYNPQTTAIYKYSSSWGSGYVYGSSTTPGYVGTVSYTYNIRDKQRITYVFDGNVCSSNEHEYEYGTTVPASEIKCTHINTTIIDGYEVVWYSDPGRTTPADTDLVMNTSYTIYGQLEKSVIRNHEFIYYELADPITVGDVTYNYITADNIETIKAAGYEITDNRTSASVSVPTSATQSTTKTAYTTTYTYDGAVVLVDRERLTASFSELRLSMEDDNKTYEEAYGRTGFYYDETNISNRSYGYVNNTPLNLKVYFARDKYQVEVITNATKTSNPEYFSFSIDQHVSLTSPSKNGYTFGGWEYEKWTVVNGENQYEEYTPTIEPGDTFIKMPAFNIRATAIWVPAEFDTTVWHYFQDANKVYQTDFAADLSENGTEDTRNITFNDEVYEDSTVYLDDDGNYIGAIVELADGTKLYFEDVTEVTSDTSTVYLAQEAYLMSASTPVTVTSEQEIACDEFAITDYSMFDYSYTQYKDDENTERYSGDDTFKAEYTMSVELYYTRTANFKIRLMGYATDGGENGLILTGSGEHFFGESVDIKAALSDGYEFVGWFNASDILSDYSDPDLTDPLRNKNLTEYTVKTSIDFDDLTAVCSTVNYAVAVKNNIDLVAVVKPSDVIAPTITIKGKTAYKYGYEAAADNELRTVAVNATFAAKEGELTADEAAKLNKESKETTVTGYKWYQVNYDVEDDELVEKNTTDLSNTTSALSFATGKEAGTYWYRCEVSYKRLDNGRTGKKSVDVKCTVSKADFEVSTAKYEGTFDNLYHSITAVLTTPSNLTLDDPDDVFEVYYSTDVKLTAANYATAGTKGALPTYRNVKHGAKYDEHGDIVSEDTVLPYTTYIYIHDLSGNYNDYTTSNKVTINPKSIDIKATNEIFSKMYDGTKVITGTPTDPESSMYKFSQGNYYEITGYIDGDEDTDSYVLSCDAEYNDFHKSTAQTFTIKDLYLVSKEDTTNEKMWNYSFPASKTLIFVGSITARPLDIEWGSQTEFIYNGELQAPTVSLKEEQTYEIPECDKDKIELEVTGAQTNVGASAYTATAVAKEVDGATYYSDDYTFDADSINKNFVINKRYIAVVPTAKTVTYDGTEQSITVYTVGPTEGIDDSGIVTGHTSTAVPASSHIDADTYHVQMKDIVIVNSKQNILNDNYDIHYPTADLVINPCTVTISGITVDQKFYDGNTNATFGIDGKSYNVTSKTDDEVGDGLTFTPHYSQGEVKDDLGVDVSKISVVYSASTAGTITANVTIDEDALTGESKGNYTLDVERSQKTASGLIVKNFIAVKALPETTVYGESVTFECSYDGILEGEISDISIVGEPGYLIRKTGTEEEFHTYNPGTDGVGTYEIKVTTDTITTRDYTFVWDEDEEYSILTITKRPVKIEKLSEIVSKDYDGNKDVLTDLEKGTHYRFVKTDADASGVLSKDTEVDLTDTYSVIYNSKDVSTANKVTITQAEINNENYNLVNTTLDIDAKIDPIPVTITANAKSIVYGTKVTNSLSTVNYTGFIEGEDKSKLTGSLTFTTSAYDTNTQSKRNVGVYENDILPGGYGAEGSVNGNYTVHYVPANLTVTVKSVEVKADNQTLYYQVGNVIGGVPGQIPEYTYVQATLAYPEDAALTTYSSDPDTGVKLFKNEEGTETGTHPIHVLTVPGQYPINFKKNTDGSVFGVTYNYNDGVNDYVNYKFVPVSAKLTVVKRQIKVVVGSITIPDKVYDGTTDIVGNPGVTSVTFDPAIATEDAAYLAENSLSGLNVTNLISNSAYPSKDVGEDYDVTLSYTLNDYMAARYTLDVENSQSTAKSSITKRPVKVTYEDAEIDYGSPVKTDYVVKEDRSYIDDSNKNVVGIIDGEELLEDFGFTLPTASDFVCSYSATSGSYSKVGNYNVKPSNMDAENYQITAYTNATLTVKPVKLAKPTNVKFSATTGTFTWSKSQKIGDVNVGGYEVRLLKHNGTKWVAVDGSNHVLDADTVSYDFLSEIRSNGPGKYRASVRALSATDAYNTVGEDTKACVKDSDYTNTAEASCLYAANVTCVYDTDTVTTKGKDTETSPTVEGVATYTIIKGESNISFASKMINATGYEVDSVTSSSSEITIGTGTKSGVNYSNSITSTSALSSSDTITLTIKLKTVKPQVTVSITGENTSVMYGYTEETLPTFTATPVWGGGIDASGYTDIVYTWYRKEGTKKYLLESTTNVCEHPTGLNAKIGVYKIYCVVSGKRIDNDETTSATSNEIVLDVTKSKFEPTVVLANWTYGAARSVPRLSITNPTEKEEIFYFAPSADTPRAQWTTDIFTDAGTYYAWAYIPVNENYAEYTSPAKAFTINKNKLSAPTNLSMGIKQGTALYGNASWDAVTGPVENAGGTGSASSITVKYKLDLYKVVDDTEVFIKTYNNITTNSCDISDKVNDTGKFKFYVTALSSNTDNCLDSDRSLGSSIVDVSGRITADEFTKTYDGTPIVLNLEFTNTDPDATVTYQWYKNGVAAQEAPLSEEDGGKSFDVTYVEQNGIYSCRIYIGENYRESTFETVTINPRPVTIESGTQSFEYDGEDHKNSSVSVSSSTPLPSTDSLFTDSETPTNGTYSSGVIKYFESNPVSNIINNVIIKHGDKIVYKENDSANEVVDNYVVTKAPGNLTITKKTITITADSASHEYDGTDFTTPTATYVGLVEGDSVTYNVNGTIKDVDSGKTTGTKSNKVSNVVIKKGEKNITSSYNIVCVDGTLTITQRPLVIVANSATKPYDKTALTEHSYDFGKVNASDEEATSLVEGDTIADSDVTYSSTSTITNFGTQDNEITSVIIKRSGSNITRNYNITYRKGTLTITKAVNPMTVNAPNKVYSGHAYNSASVSNVEEESQGTVTYTYYKKNGTDDYEELSSAPVDVGSYAVVAHITSTSNYKATDTAKKDFSITKLGITVTANSSTRTYNGQPLTNGGFTLSASTPLADTDEFGDYTVTGTITDYVANGVANKITAIAIVNKSDSSKDVTSNYNITKVDGKLTINKYAITITAGSDSKEYDGNALTKNSYTNTALVSGDSIESVTVTGTITYYGTTGSTANVPSAAVIKRGTGDSAVDATGSYNITYVNGTLSITKKALTVKADDATKVYDGTALTKATATVTGNLEDDVVTYTTSGTITHVTASHETGTATNSIVANSVKVTHGTTDITTSYAITTQTGTLTITKRPIVIVADNDSRPYDGTPLTKHSYHLGKVNPADTALTSFGEGDSLANADLVFSADSTITNEGSQSNVITAATIKRGTENVNRDYSIRFDNGTLTIVKTDDTVVVTAPDKTYDGHAYDEASSTHKGTGTVTYTYYVKNGDSYTELESAPISVGDYGVSAHITASLNYKEKTTDIVPFVVSQRAITLTAATDSRTYNGQPLTNTGYTLSATTPLADTDEFGTVTVVGTITDYVANGVDNKITSVEIVNKSDSSKDVTSNYNITKVDGKLTINKYAITITADSDSKEYDGTALTKNSYTNTALVSGDSIESVTITGSITYYGTTGSTANVPSAAVIKRGTTDATGSYNITYVNGTLSITKKALTVKADDATKVYDGTALTKETATITVTGKPSGDVVSYETQGTITHVTANQETGTATNSIKANSVKVMNGSTDVTSSYSITTQTGTLTITKRPVVIVAGSSSKPYDGSALINHTWSRGKLNSSDASETTFGTGDSLADADVTFKSTSTITNEGTQANEIQSVVIRKGSENVNRDYDIRLDAGTLTIEKTDDTITVVAPDSVYDGAAYSKANVTNKKGTGTVTYIYYSRNGENYTQIDSAPVDAGAYGVKAHITASQNYKAKDTAIVSFEIEKRAIEITANSSSQTYNGQPLTNNTFTLTASTPLATTDQFGDYVISGTITDYVEGGVDNTITSVSIVNKADTSKDVTENYTITKVKGNLSIEKRPITITADSDSKEYDGTPLTNSGYTYTDPAEGDVVESVTVNGTITYYGITGNTTNVPSAAVIKRGTTDATGSYNITYANGTLSITKKALSVTADSASKVYDGAALTKETATVSGNLSGDTVTYTTSGTITHVTAGNETGVQNNSIVNGSVKVMHDSLDITSSYAVTTHTGTLTITKKNLAIKAATYSRGYIRNTPLTDHNFSYVKWNESDSDVTALASTDKLESADVTFTDASTITLEGEVDNEISSVVIRNSSTNEDVTRDYNLRFEKGKLSITRADATVDIEPSDAVYNGHPYENPLPIYETGKEDNDGVLIYKYFKKTGDTFNELSGAPTDVGTYYVQLFVSDAILYSDMNTGIREFSITKKNLTITASSDDKNYDGTVLNVPTPKYSIEGLADTDKVKSINVTGSIYNIGSCATVASNALIVRINNESVNVNGNYTINYVDGTLTIHGRTIKIKPKDESKTYDGTALVPSQIEIIEGSLATGDTIVSYDLSGTQTIAGSSDSTVASAVVKNSKNEIVPYTINYEQGSLVVSKKAIEITADDATREYDNTALTKHTYTITGGNLVNNQTIDAVTFTTASTITNVGSADNEITAVVIKDGADDVTSNYDISFVKGLLKVTKRKITLKADDASKVYDALSMSKGTYSITGGTLVTGDTLDITVSGTRTEAGTTDNVISSYKVMRGTTEITSQYEVTTLKGTLTISKRPITLKAKSDNKVYDGTPLSLNGYDHTEGELLTGDVIENVTVSGSITEAGVVDNVISSTPKIMHYDTPGSTGVDRTDNYNVKCLTGKLTVTKAGEAISVFPEDKEYDGETYANPAVTHTGSGKVTFEYYDKDMQKLNGAPLKTGEYFVIAKIKDSRNHADADSEPAAFKITKRTLSVKSKDATKVYDKKELVCKEVIVDETTPLASKDAIVSVITTGKLTDAGTCENTLTAIVIKNNNTVDVTDCYDITYSSGTLTITKANQTITGKMVKVTYDGKEHKVKATTDGDSILVYSDNNSLTMPGKETVTVTAPETNNYFAASINIKLIVEKRDITLKAGDAEKKFDGTELVCHKYEIKAGSLAKTDKISNVKFKSSLTEVGTCDNVIGSVVIKNSEGKNVTEAYNIKLQKGTLKIIKAKEDDDDDDEDDEDDDDKKEIVKPVNPDTPDKPKPSDDEEEDDDKKKSDDDNKKSDDDNKKSDDDNKKSDDEKPSDDSDDKGKKIKIWVKTDDEKEDEEKKNNPSVHELADEVITDEEYDSSDDIELKLTVTHDPTEKLSKETIDELKKINKNKNIPKKGLKFGQVVDISLDKRVNSEWTNIERTIKVVPIVIDIPEEIQFDDAVYYIAREIDGIIELLYDEDDNPKTITIRTNVYREGAILYERHRCYYHIIIIVTGTVVVLLQIFVFKKRKDEDDEDEDNKDKDEEDKKQKASKISPIVVLAGDLIYIICAILGSCKIDIPAAIICFLLTGGYEYYRRKKKDIKDEDGAKKELS